MFALYVETPLKVQRPMHVQSALRREIFHENSVIAAIFLFFFYLKNGVKVLNNENKEKLGFGFLSDLLPKFKALFEFLFSWNPL